MKVAVLCGKFKESFKKSNLGEPRFRLHGEREYNGTPERVVGLAPDGVGVFRNEVTIDH